MKSILAITLAFTLTATLLAANSTEAESSDADMKMSKEQEDLQLLDQILNDYFYLHSRQIFDTDTINMAGKRILIKYLYVRLIRIRTRVVEALEKKNAPKKNGYMHWRQG